MRRILVTVATAIAFFVVGVAPAGAHSVSGVSSTNYRTRLKGLSPTVDGVSVRVIEAGSRLQLSNRTATEVLVEGYQGEPMFRVGRRGVFENRLSPSVYISRSRSGGSPPEFADAGAKPQWQRVSTGTTARWHDHRIHWMGAGDPPQVKREPGRLHVIVPKWKVPLHYGPRPLAVTGDLVWVPGPSPTRWLALSAALALGTAAVGARRRRAWRILAALLAVLVAGDVVHAVGVAFTSTGTTGDQLGRIATGATFSLVSWGTGVLGVVLLLRRKIDGVFAAAFTGLVVALLGGLVDLGKLSRSEIAFAWSPDLARGCVALSLGLGLGLTAAAALVVWAESRETAARSVALAAANQGDERDH